MALADVVENPMNDAERPTEPEVRVQELADAVGAPTAENIAKAPHLTAPFFPEESAAICGAEPGKAHVYDAAASTRCPACGTYERMMIRPLLSPSMFGSRIMATIRALRRKPPEEKP
jgi:hypothetical protein